MHKPFYASGFLYHLKTEQILLHQPGQKHGASSAWSLFGGTSRRGESTTKAFHRITYELLKVKLDLDDIYPVYDYFHNVFKKIHYVFYAHVPKVQNFRLRQGGTLSWFTFKQTTKLPFTDQTKQDIVVAQRVINAHARSNEAKGPLPTI